MKVYIGFSRAKDDRAILSRIISSVEKRPYSHAYVRFEDPTTNENMIYQASHGRVNLVHFERFEQSNIVAKEYIIECDLLIFLNFYSYAQRRLGVKYSISQLLWLGLKKLLNLKKWPEGIYNYISNGQSESICSEEAASAAMLLDKKDAVLFDDQEMDQISPSNLDAILELTDLEVIYYGQTG